MFHHPWYILVRTDKYWYVSYFPNISAKIVLHVVYKYPISLPCVRNSLNKTVKNQVSPVRLLLCRQYRVITALQPSHSKFRMSFFIKSNYWPLCLWVASWSWDGISDHNTGDWYLIEVRLLFWCKPLECQNTQHYPPISKFMKYRQVQRSHLKSCRVFKIWTATDISWAEIGYNLVRLV